MNQIYSATTFTFNINYSELVNYDSSYFNLTFVVFLVDDSKTYELNEFAT